LDEKGERPAHAWFLSYAPENNAQVALAVFIEGGLNGADYAVPVAARIYQYLFRQPDLPPLLVEKERQTRLRNAPSQADEHTT
jgi:cell division protein FtsI/penicillin-binding protein 2